jgi:hypothetical protein
MDPAITGIPGDRGRDAPVTEVRERRALSRVLLAQVVSERPEMTRVTVRERSQCATGPDGTRCSHTFVSVDEGCMQGEEGCCESP